MTYPYQVWLNLQSPIGLFFYEQCRWLFPLADYLPLIKCKIG